MSQTASQPAPGVRHPRQVAPASATLIDFETARRARQPHTPLVQPDWPYTPLVRIYRPARDVNRVGGARARCWVLEFEPVRRPLADHLMGWIGGGDPRQHVRLVFPTRAHAVAFAQRQGWRYEVSDPSDGPVRLEALHPAARELSLSGLGQWHPVM